MNHVFDTPLCMMPESAFCLLEVFDDLCHISLQGLSCPYPAFLVCLEIARLGKLQQRGYICISPSSWFLLLKRNISYISLASPIQNCSKLSSTMSTSFWSSFSKENPSKMSKASSPTHANKTEVRYFGDSMSNVVAASWLFHCLLNFRQATSMFLAWTSNLLGTGILGLNWCPSSPPTSGLSLCIHALELKLTTLLHPKTASLLKRKQWRLNKINTVGSVTQHAKSYTYFSRYCNFQFRETVQNVTWLNPLLTPC